MITVEVDGRNIVFLPKYLHDYIQKVNYIKSSRPSPYAALEGIPSSMSDAGKTKMAEMAFSAFMRMSSVSFEEELAFDTTLEGRYHSIWSAAKDSIPEWSKLTPQQGVNAARIWFDKLENEKAREVLMAIRGVDQRALAKNSDGPPES